MADFAELKKIVDGFTGRGGDTPIGVYTFATSTLNRKLRIIPMERSRIITAVDGVVPYPERFLELIQVRTTGACPKLLTPQITQSEGIENNPYSGDSVYRLTGEGLDISPAPADGDEYEVIYYEALKALDGDDDTNAALENGLIDAYTYLVQSKIAVGLQNFDGAAGFKMEAEMVIMEANQQSNNARISGATLITRQPLGTRT